MSAYDQAQPTPSPHRTSGSWGLGKWTVVALLTATFVIGGRLIFSALTADPPTSSEVPLEASTDASATTQADSAALDPLLASGPFELIQAEKAGAIFMLGLILGMSSGITLFFLHLRRKERHARRFRVEGDCSFDNWPVSSDRTMPLPPASPMELGDGDEMIEQRDPWERSVDWWKEPDDGDQ